MKKSLLYIIAGLLGVFILVTGIVFWAGWRWVRVDGEQPTIVLKPKGQ